MVRRQETKSHSILQRKCWRKHLDRRAQLIGSEDFDFGIGVTDTG